MSDSIFRCLAGATTRDIVTINSEGDPEVSLYWLDETKGRLSMEADRIAFQGLVGKRLDILHNTIQGALLLKVKATRFHYLVLWVVHAEGNHGFCFRQHEYWDKPLPFPVSREDSNTPRATLIKGFAAKFAGELLEEAVAGLIGTASLTLVLGGKVAGLAASNTAESVVAKADDKRREQEATSPAIQYALNASKSNESGE